MKQTVVWAAAVTAGFSILLLTCGSFLNTTQSFTPSRYALLAATVDAASLQQSGQPGNPRRVLCKLDSVTGKVWVLQLTVAGEGNPAVLSASWSPVAEQPVNAAP